METPRDRHRDGGQGNPWVGSAATIVNGFLDPPETLAQLVSDLDVVDLALAFHPDVADAYESRYASAAAYMEKMNSAQALLVGFAPLGHVLADLATRRDSFDFLNERRREPGEEGLRLRVLLGMRLAVALGQHSRTLVDHAVGGLGERAVKTRLTSRFNRWAARRRLGLSLRDVRIDIEQAFRSFLEADELIQNGVVRAHSRNLMYEGELVLLHRRGRAPDTAAMMIAAHELAAGLHGL